MKPFKSTIIPLAASAMLLSASVASVASAAPANGRTDAAVTQSDAMGEGGGSSWLIGLVAVGALIGIFLLAGSETGDDSPVSP